MVGAPALAASKRVGKMLEGLRNKERTAEGSMFVDFTVTDENGKEQKLSDYVGKGLTVLGIAVWDAPADTQKAIEELQIPWAQITNAGSVPTDLYGINGIPHIILFAPDGTIVARDLRGEAMIAKVAEVMKKK